ncbi:anti-sigma factor family protein [Microvirga puerhi]|uniref:Anti-sigma factor n=1 Tax=Microvirga puerhi TaxID=2876078 RepID=A0ABS7VPD2_9HYPH|nr:anti-sigma factor [Microvirga puerhi]MBZ6076960.1 anti-sigma factor [Microvirga puerhi]
MTDAPHHDRPSDEDLVAYLDGELSSDARFRIARAVAEDHELQRRLILLSGGQRPFRDAFAPLLAQAPEDKLKAMLDGLPGPVTPEEAAQPTRHSSNRWKALAAGLALFLAGAGAGWMGSSIVRPALEQPKVATESDDDDWRQSVAAYISLYTSETLASIPDDARAQELEIASVRAKTGLALSPQKLALPDLTLKRAQVLEYDQKPLGQIAYLDPESGPLALCIITGGGPDADKSTEQRLGLNVVYWTKAGRSFMLIGRAAMPRLQNWADEVSGRLSG